MTCDGIMHSRPLYKLMRLSELTADIKKNTDPQYQQQKCSPKSQVFAVQGKPKNTKHENHDVS